MFLCEIEKPQPSAQATAPTPQPPRPEVMVVHKVKHGEALNTRTNDLKPFFEVQKSGPYELEESRKHLSTARIKDTKETLVDPGYTGWWSGSVLEIGKPKYEGTDHDAVTL